MFDMQQCLPLTQTKPTKNHVDNGIFCTRIWFCDLKGKIRFEKLGGSEKEMTF